jgi:uncharacterized protein
MNGKNKDMAIFKRTEFPHAIREIENTWITLTDGTRLAARIWLPVDAEAHPVPAVLEYLPYRKGDGMSERDSRLHPYVAGFGYALVRVDIRGTGESDGILHDEYLKQEHDDALEIIDWLTAQPWCSGNVGIIGISWSGFNGLQIAARRPAALKAIITLCSTDDRYADDVHYMGGSVCFDQLPWASYMFGSNAQPPDPRLVGERWREMWLTRMRDTPPYVEAWMSHQTRDAFWQHGSVCENYADITCAVLAVGGWADGYSNAIPRLLAGLSCPRKGLIGPWAHAHPQDALPGPSIGWLQEVLRWWDYWLKGIDNGAMDGPMLRAWMQDSVPAQPYYETRPGRWVAEATWPSPNIRIATLHAHADGSLRSTRSAADTRVSVGTHLLHGMDSQVFCPYGYPGELPAEQSADDGRALTFTVPLAEARPDEILGFPEVTLALAADKPNAFVAVRLCDVSPTGESLLVSWGQLNLTHRDSHTDPKPVTPGEMMRVRVRLNAIAHRLGPGHRWRVSVSPSYWPHAWPSPENATLTLDPAGCALHLPVRSDKSLDDTLPAFGPPEESVALATETVREESNRREWRIDRITGEVTLHVEFDHGATRYSHNGLLSDSLSIDDYIIHTDDPLRTRVVCQRVFKLSGANWATHIETYSTMTCDAGQFYLVNKMKAFENDALVFEKVWQHNVPRQLV